MSGNENEKAQKVIPPEPQSRPAGRETKPTEPVAQRSLAASGALQLLADVSQNPSVVAAVGAATGVTVHKVLNRPPKAEAPKPDIWKRGDPK